MLVLKDYQQQALTVLRTYLEQARLHTPAEAFTRTVRTYPTDTHLQSYHTRWNLEHIPYVCLRLPTGGGKTLLAAHTIGVATDVYLDRAYPFVLWLVPTNTIRQQTVQALRNASHPYHQALTAQFSEQGVAVFDIEDITTIRPADAFEKACIIVATMQTLRVSDANKMVRKVYEHNENFEQHFAKLSNTMPDLDRLPNGKVAFSFVNMVHQLRPLVIVDEAHKMISQLSGEVMYRINPACVIEFTATPVESNVLFRAFPSQLKTEEMVKLPFNLLEHPEWESAVRGAMQTRASLAEDAKHDSQYIRPLILFQAEKANQQCTVDVLKQFLLDEGAQETEIAIATGEQRELDDIDIFDPHCPVRYIITIEALKEGWDCSFAYVFCSVAHIKSAVDVEQLLGRVMRMPYAKLRQQPRLNMAYAHVVASGFGLAAAEINGCMLNMGFDADEAADNIRQLTLLPNKGDIWGDMPLFAEHKKPTATELTLYTDKRPNFDGLDAEEVRHITVERQEKGFSITTRAMITHAVEERLLAATKKEKQFQIRHSISQHRRNVLAALPPSPAQQGMIFAVPLLLWEREDAYEQIDAEWLLAEDWSPLQEIDNSKPLLQYNDFTYDPQIHVFQFDLQGERMTYRELDGQQQGLLYAMPSTYDVCALTRWLDGMCRQNDVQQLDMLEYCRRAVQALLDAGHSLKVLYQGKKALAQLILHNIATVRAKAKQRTFQTLLCGKQPVKVTFDRNFTFPTAHYAEHIARYQGSYVFKKHYVDIPRDLKAHGEEFRCAQAIDCHPHVTTWLRNVDRQYGSFFLPTSSDNFYPDFVAKLDDGRILVIEYKGQHLLQSDDTREKQNIGELWASKSNGKGCFLLVCESVEAYTFEKQLLKVFPG